MGKLITFEGVEGAGKTTAISAVAAHLQQRDIPVIHTREPGATALGKQLREILLHGHQPVSGWAELFLYLADRVQHIEEMIAPALQQGQMVLCDRFTDSTIAYQGYGRGLALDKVVTACRTAQTVPVDRTYLFDLDPEAGLARVAARNQGHDRMEQEKIGFHRRIRAGFLALAAEDADRVVVLDATLSEDALMARILNDLEAQFL